MGTFCAVPSGTRSVGCAYPALPCRALDCSVPSGLGLLLRQACPEHSAELELSS